MTIPSLPRLPQEKVAAVERALYQTFGTTVLDEAELMTRGLSPALVYKGKRK